MLQLSMIDMIATTAFVTVHRSTNNKAEFIPMKHSNSFSENEISLNMC